MSASQSGDVGNLAIHPTAAGIARVGAVGDGRVHLDLFGSAAQRVAQPRWVRRSEATPVTADWTTIAAWRDGLAVRPVPLVVSDQIAQLTRPERLATQYLTLGAATTPDAA